jgi:hypothetical protein
VGSGMDTPSKPRESRCEARTTAAATISGPRFQARRGGVTRNASAWFYESAERRPQCFSITIGRGHPTELRERGDVGAVELKHDDAGATSPTFANSPHPLGRC